MPIKIHKRGEVWHYRGTAAGRRLRGTTGTTDKATAQRIAAEVESRAWKCHLDGPGAHVTFAQAAIAYRAAEKPTRFLDRIEDHWRDTLIREITAGAIRQSAIKLYPKAKGATRNRQVIAPTQAIINHAAALEWCAPIRVKRFEVEAKTKAPATQEWAEAFARHASPHLGALCLFMFGTAARLGEAIALTWANVDLSQKVVILSGRKPKPWTRRAHLPPAVVVALANIPSKHAPGERVFQYLEPGNVKQVWANAAKRAGIAPLTPHSCRHGFATTLLQKGIDPKTVARLGGWKDVATVMKFYAHAMNDPTVSDRVFGTNPAQDARGDLPSIGKQSKISA